MSDPTADTIAVNVSDAPKIGIVWGDDISEERKRELDVILAASKAEAGRGKRSNPFRGMKLTGADAFYLAVGALVGTADPISGEPIIDLFAAHRALTDRRPYALSFRYRIDLSALNLAGANLHKAQLGGAILCKADLSGANLGGAHLEHAYLQNAHLSLTQFEEAHLAGANLVGAEMWTANFSSASAKGAYFISEALIGARFDKANLMNAVFSGANLELASLFQAELGHANFDRAHMQNAFFGEAKMDHANLSKVQLAGARLVGAQLGACNLTEADLTGVDLRGAVLDAETQLKDVNLGEGRKSPALVADVRWGGANLAVVDWSPLIEPVTQLGDEREARAWRPRLFTASEENLARKERASKRAKHAVEQRRERLETYRAAVRANRQLATALREQGMNEEADAFPYRAQIVQRSVFAQQGKRGRALLSLFSRSSLTYWPDMGISPHVASICISACSLASPFSSSSLAMAGSPSAWAPLSIRTCRGTRR